MYIHIWILKWTIENLILSEQNMSGQWYDGLETPQYKWNVNELKQSPIGIQRRNRFSKTVGSVTPHYAWAVLPKSGTICNP